MSGFMSNSTAMSVFTADGAKFNPEALKKHVFSTSIDEEGKRAGWVGFGDPLDLDFEFGLDQSGFAGFSLRIDSRSVSSAAVAIQLAEALKEKEAAGQPIKGKAKKELKEAIIGKLTSAAPFVPSLTDCLWDLNQGRLLISTTSAKAAQSVLKLFQASFGLEPAPLVPKQDISAVFAEICRNEQYDCAGFILSPVGSASLATANQEDTKALVAVQNNANSVVSALDEGLNIRKLRLLATSEEDSELQYDFALDTALGVSGLKLPKAEKDAEKDAEFFLKADACSNMANILDALANK